MTKRQNVVYIACLLPLPLLLISLGVMFVTVALILNIIWLFIAIRGVFVDENKKYADTMFYFSLLYLILVFGGMIVIRSEEHTSELQSRGHLVCRLLLEKKKCNVIY